jgi:hypothetical protein
LNDHSLKFNPRDLVGLLDDEPATDAEGILIKIPEGLNAMGEDMEDDQGNRLFWDEDGKSHVILAPTNPAVTGTSMKSIQQHADSICSAPVRKSPELLKAIILQVF